MSMPGQRMRARPETPRSDRENATSRASSITIAQPSARSNRSTCSSPTSGHRQRVKTTSAAAPVEAAEARNSRPAQGVSAQGGGCEPEAGNSAPVYDPTKNAATAPDAANALPGHTRFSATDRPRHRPGPTQPSSTSTARKLTALNAPNTANAHGPAETDALSPNLGCDAPGPAVR